ncbi:uncharacterized protein BX663DRAFT_544849 [Cokeromyces recurvatus]|uniref:uncharacterized protein n=1 Tax=Cokeromyces recurvatus TaxID=90255 RepID=UPI002220245A|nr:uncharacterized protein BX663DRAFT_544849 [Cokeromyces recurvatus]KAI7900375.1 hypothetical protein BX663DRAFT_544849 [Cokeromyces recurvatus]
MRHEVCHVSVIYSNVVKDVTINFGLIAWKSFNVLIWYNNLTFFESSNLFIKLLMLLVNLSKLFKLVNDADRQAIDTVLVTLFHDFTKETFYVHILFSYLLLNNLNLICYVVELTFT